MECHLLVFPSESIGEKSVACFKHTVRKQAAVKLTKQTKNTRALGVREVHFSHGHGFSKKAKFSTKKIHEPNSKVSAPTLSPLQPRFRDTQSHPQKRSEQAMGRAK